VDIRCPNSDYRTGLTHVPTLESLPLGDVLAVLKPTYSSVDVRLVLGRVDGTWTVAAGILAATDGTVSSVRRQHAAIAKKRATALRAGLAPSDLHMPNWNHLNAWLGFDLFDVNGKSTVNLELSFPIRVA
jgi:hypothetical protein